MCSSNIGHDVHDLLHNAPDPLLPTSTEKQSAILQLMRDPQDMRVDKVLAQDKATPIDVANLGPAGAKSRALRNTGRVAGLAIGAVAGGEAVYGALGGETASVPAVGESATSSSTAATGVAPAATQGAVAGGAAPTAGAAAGTVAPTSMSVAEMIRMGASIAGIAGAAANIAATRRAPKPPSPEATPAAPQPGRQPDFAAVSDRVRNMFGPSGPFAGNESTFLTGAGGIPASKLNIGRNILLGS
jgi:hypothetical protein